MTSSGGLQIVVRIDRFCFDIPVAIAEKNRSVGADSLDPKLVLFCRRDAPHLALKSVALPVADADPDYGAFDRVAFLVEF